MPRYKQVKWEEAACKGAPTNLFYTIEESRRKDSSIEIGILRQICAGCPIYRECLAYALENEQFGVWGGMTTKEREAFNGKASYALSGAIIQKLGDSGIPIEKIVEAWREYSANE